MLSLDGYQTRSCLQTMFLMALTRSKRSFAYPLDAKSNNISVYYRWPKRALGMSMQPIYYGLTRAVASAILIIFPTVFFVSCSTAGGTGGQSRPVIASKSTDPAKDKAAERRRWSERVERDNQLDPSGSGPGSYGSFGPRFTW